MVDSATFANRVGRVEHLTAAYLCSLMSHVCVASRKGRVSAGQSASFFPPPHISGLLSSWRVFRSNCLRYKTTTWQRKSQIMLGSRTTRTKTQRRLATSGGSFDIWSKSSQVRESFEPLSPLLQREKCAENQDMSTEEVAEKLRSANRLFSQGTPLNALSSHLRSRALQCKPLMRRRKTRTCSCDSRRSARRRRAR